MNRMLPPSAAWPTIPVARMRLAIDATANRDANFITESLSVRVRPHLADSTVNARNAKQRHNPAVNPSDFLPFIAMAGVGLLFLLVRVYTPDAPATRTTRASIL